MAALSVVRRFSFRNTRALVVVISVLIAVLARAAVADAASVQLVSYQLTSGNCIYYSRGAGQVASCNNDAVAAGSSATGDVRLLRNDGVDTLLVADSFLDLTGFSALRVIANDEPGTRTEQAISSAEYVMTIKNTSAVPLPMQLNFHLAPTLLHLHDMTTGGLGVPNPGSFVGPFDQAAQVFFSIKGNGVPAWTWFEQLSGGAHAAELLPSVLDPQHIGTPVIAGAAPPSGAIAPATELAEDFDEFSGRLDFGNLASGSTFTLDYFIQTFVGLAGLNDTGASGGYVTAGDPFNLGAGPAGSFVFTAGDFSTAAPSAVPEPGTAALLVVCLPMLIARRRGRRVRIAADTPPVHPGDQPTLTT
jgi:hypothetical protein